MSLGPLGRTTDRAVAVLRIAGSFAARECLYTQKLSAERACSCGGTLHYQRLRAATVLSVCGRVTYARAYHAGCVCGQGCALLNEAYSLQPGRVSAGLAELLTLAGWNWVFTIVGAG